MQGFTGDGSGRVIVTPEIETILEAIATDRTNGATALAERGLDALELLARTLSDDAIEAEKLAVALARRIDQVRPAMGAIGVQAVFALTRARSLVDKGMQWTEALSQATSAEREALGQADQAIADLAQKEIGTGGRIVSISSSATAYRVIVGLAPTIVRIGEGNRLGDGIRAAEWLSERGIAVEIVPDAALPVVTKGARAVVIGADQVLADGAVINRCGSFSLALGASHWAVPVFVVCQRIKLSGQSQVPIETTNDLFHELPEGVTGRAPLFDKTPPSLVHRILTETQALSPIEAGAQARAIASQRESVLGFDSAR
ncbi:MAG: hypothetical protein QNJ97_19285 [Myxococcota bacterium]|nr:hypothetical protein [Myxococcota bacterium]